MPLPGTLTLPLTGEAMAQRLLESGITSVYWDIGSKKYHGRVKKFIDAVVEGGVSLKETKAYKVPK
jgi:ribosomal protein L18